MASIELKSYNTGNGIKCCLVRFGGPKWLQVLIMDKQLTVIKVPKSDERYMRQALPNEQGSARLSIFRKDARINKTSEEVPSRNNKIGEDSGKESSRNIEDPGR